MTGEESLRHGRPLPIIDMTGKIILPLEDRGFLIAHEGTLPHELAPPEASDLLFKESEFRIQNLDPKNLDH